MRRLFHDLKILITTNLWVIPVIAALVGALFYFAAPPPPMHARMATGLASGGYHAFGLRLKRELAEQGFELELVETRGSQENLQKLLHDEVQMAMVQSGQELDLTAVEREHLNGLGVMYKEPLWLFARSDINPQIIEQLKPLRLAIGSPDSGTLAVTSALFTANQIAPDQYPQGWQRIGGSRALEALLSNELDGAFFIGPAQNQLIQRLATEPSVHLISLRRSQAYLARLPYLTQVNVSEGMLNLAHDSPAQNIETLGPVATLVAGESFHPSLTPLILEAAKNVLAQGSLLDDAGSYPAKPPRSMQTLSEADYYYEKGLPILQRYVPFRIASLADRYIILAIPLLVLLFPLFKAIGPIYQWRIRARIYRWYKHLREIDQQLYNGQLKDTLDAEINRLETLEDELGRIEVPLSYSAELYQLHMHVRYMVERLKDYKQRGTEDASVG